MKKSQTQQQHKDSCNINNKIARFRKTGLIMGNNKQPQYGDFTSGQHLHDSMLQVQAAKDQFMELPGKIRARFHNSPVKLLNFLSDKNNKKEAIELGLIPDPTPTAQERMAAIMEKKEAAAAASTPPTGGQK